ncbi:MAG: hypothetical protein KME42_19515 [Tildeniella nuda ZEHNDER 1965/U140]|nr:hypothetical protein [Tildeniella nuda ZEHNDER 1965/U140]
MGDASLFLNAEGDTRPTQILYLIEPSYLDQSFCCRERFEPTHDSWHDA